MVSTAVKRRVWRKTASTRSQKKLQATKYSMNTLEPLHKIWIWAGHKVDRQSKTDDTVWIRYWIDDH